MARSDFVFLLELTKQQALVPCIVFVRLRLLFSSVILADARSPESFSSPAFPPGRCRATRLICIKRTKSLSHCFPLSHRHPIPPSISERRNYGWYLRSQYSWTDFRCPFVLLKNQKRGITLSLSPPFSRPEMKERLSSQMNR